MIIVGLTGGIATGKSTTADFFRERGIAVFDADRTVHQLLDVAGLAVSKVVEVFGDDVLRSNGAIDRNVLGQRIFKNEFDRQKLERILHPLVANERENFLLHQRQVGAPMVVLDIPLLFEIGTHKLCDLVIVTNLPPHIQRERAMSRKGMTGDRLTGILNSQMPLSEKASRADFVLDTRNDPDMVRRQLFEWLDQIMC
tara:strand:+ start:367 stop:960 length:594 start_codon:yes stop_codon:yes gene_type:complete